MFVALRAFLRVFRLLFVAVHGGLHLVHHVGERIAQLVEQAGIAVAAVVGVGAVLIAVLGVLRILLLILVGRIFALARWIAVRLILLALVETVVRRF